MYHENSLRIVYNIFDIINNSKIDNDYIFTTIVYIVNSVNYANKRASSREEITFGGGGVANSCNSAL